MMLPLLLVGSLYAAAAQGGSQAQAVTDLVVWGSDDALVTEVSRHPDAARTAFGDYLGQSAMTEAERLARAYFTAWTDPFLLQEARRFERWSAADRRLKLTADSLRLAGNEAYGYHGVPAAIALWRESLGYSERLSDQSGAAKSLGNIGAGFYTLGQLDSARVHLSQAYEMAIEVGDLRTAAGALTNLANIAYDVGDMADAADRYAEASDLLARTGSYRFQSATQHNLALVSMSLGDLRGARSALGESIRLSRLHGYPDDEAEGLTSLAEIGRAEGAYGEAESLLDRALDLSQETGNQGVAAGALHSLGILWTARGDYRKAESFLTLALESYTRLGRLPDVVDARQDLARALTAAGDLRGGLRQVQAATRLADSLALGARRNADLLLTAADINLALNEYPRALAQFAQAQTSYRAADDVAGQAAALEGLGYLSLIRGDGAEARDALAQALRLQTGVGRPDPRAIALTRLSLAAAEQEMGDVDAARRTLQLAGDGLSSVDDVVGQAAVVAMLGALELGAGHTWTADSLYRLGLQLVGQRPAPTVSWQLHAGLAETLAAMGHPSKAAGELRLAIATIEASAATLLLVEQRSAFRADKTRVYDQLAAIELDLGHVAAAFEVSERVRGQRLLAAVSRGRMAIPAGMPTDLIDREQDTRQHIAQLTRSLRRGSNSRMVLREPGAGLSLESDDRRAGLARAQTEYAGILAEMKTMSPEYSSLVDPVPASLNDVSASLATDQVLIEYLVADSSTIAFVVTRDTAVALVLDIGREPLGDLVRFSRGVIARGDQADPGDLWRSPLQRLHQHLIGPIEQGGWLDGRESLVIVPHGELHYLPFQALVRPGDQTFLAQRYAVAYAPSASVWLRLMDRVAGRTRQAGERPVEPAGPTVLAMAPRVDQLPGSRYEVELIGRLFGEDAEVFVGDLATEEVLRTEAPRFDIVHLATYGVLNKANPLFSFVELAQTGDDAGVLEVHEIYALGLNAMLVTLSACETGLGVGTMWDVPPGDDWVSLSAAFLGAGAANVLASLWRVEDLATAELMQRFYRQLTPGTAIAKSLAEAQRELIANPDTAHPFYWAGFVLIGEGRGFQ